MNKVILIGNLARDPETKVMSNGKKRTTFTVAVTRPHQGQDGERTADFILCTAYEKTAELIDKYLKKGRKCSVEAHIRTGKYEKDGRTVYTTDFITERIEFLSTAQAGDTGAETEPDAPEPEQAAANTGNGGFTEVIDDDLPF